MQTQQMANPRHEPTDDQDRVLNVLKEGRDSDGPWGRANPKLVREETGLEKSKVEYALRELTTAGWLHKLTSGLYEFNEDPREEE